jgi:hypothetical protein
MYQKVEATQKKKKETTKKLLEKKSKITKTKK